MLLQALVLDLRTYCGAAFAGALDLGLHASPKANLATNAMKHSHKSGSKLSKHSEDLALCALEESRLIRIRRTAKSKLSKNACGTGQAYD